MRILYGVVGQGFGHATRSRTVIEGLRLAYDGNEVDPLATVCDLMARLPAMAVHNLARFLDVNESFRPDVVISDGSYRADECGSGGSAVRAGGETL